ncbi:hypothetical protein B0H15DRAFT_811217 [Mycena belliarum]|uniref:Uncharacterized protein n=1 Tax=Mycena belliarum TaxID=1033014 RepID=A0AAD6UK57_9AGAR|nr:hypothetical protein B0H15DRAFT_811217 [Mycena belliae]
MALRGTTVAYASLISLCSISFRCHMLRTALAVNKGIYCLIQDSLDSRGSNKFGTDLKLQWDEGYRHMSSGIERLHNSAASWERMPKFQVEHALPFTQRFRMAQDPIHWEALQAELVLILLPAAERCSKYIRYPF